jgi:DNA-binding HxlR family transcriptional regulator
VSGRFIGRHSDGQGNTRFGFRIIDIDVRTLWYNCVAIGTKRTYGEGCAAAHALDLVGERWALLVVRELLLGPKRFTDLRAGIPHASPNVLSQRLRELEDAAVVRRDTLPPPAASKVYELTAWGRDLEPVIMALGAWGVRSPRMPRGEPMSVDCQMLALKTVFDVRAAVGLDARYQLHVDGQRFRVHVLHGRLELRRGTIEHPNATVTTDSATLGALLWGGAKLEDMVRAGRLELEGSDHAVLRFLDLFPLPEPVATPVEA